MTDSAKSPSPQTPAAARASATVMIVRDGAKGLEIFMVARDRQVDMATGAVIFPGGKVDADDAAPSWGALSAPRAPDRSYWIAALRETYEESGLLLANTGEAHVEAEAAAKINAETRTPLLDGKQTYSAILQARGLLPAFDRMTPFAHWVTPVSQPKRFKTHFFLAAAPAGQQAVHDGREAVSSFWMRPIDLLEEGAAGRQTLVPPTRLNLEMLAESGTTVADAFAAAKARRIVTVMPQSSKTPEGIRLTIPADAGYKTTELLIKRPG
jgi:8-oxo-dGTP pyrophosphatase MutT (NUDIX family)